jgi:excisionase family DNA binding protein
VAAPAHLRPRRLLQSWKEIAGYLGVTVRTVQRWEKESDLPIHRQGNGRKARVVAYSDELDGWLQQEPQEEVALLQTLPWRYVLGLAAVLLVASAVLGVIFLRTPVPFRVTAEGNKLLVLAENGRLCWERTFPSLDASKYGERDSGQILDLDEDGEPEILFNVIPADPASSRGKLVCYEADGTQRWEFYYGRAQAHEGREINANYVGHFCRLVKSGGRKYLLTVANHHLWFPCQVALLDPASGELLDEYWHPGGMFKMVVQDLQRDQNPEVLLSGINNPGLGLGHGALAVLQIPFSPRNPESAGSSFFDFTQGKELAYFLFPRSEMAVAEGDLPIISDMSVTPDRRILVHVPGGGVHAFYYLDFDLRLVDADFSDNLMSVHDRLWRMGLIDHPFKREELSWMRGVRRFLTAPDGNSPEIEKLMRGDAR